MASCFLHSMSVQLVLARRFNSIGAIRKSIIKYILLDLLFVKYCKKPQYGLIEGAVRVKYCWIFCV